MKTYAVLGLGSIGKKHLQNLKELYPNDRIVAISSSGKNPDIPTNADANVSIQNAISMMPRFVIIASPASYHLDHARQFIFNGTPVLIEKPLSSLCPSSNEVKSFVQQADHEKVGVGYCLRFLPSAIYLKNFLEKNYLGKIYNVDSHVGQYLPSWRPNIDYRQSVSATKSLGGGALFELSHELDYLLWLFGPLHVKHVNIRNTSELSLEVEDLVDCVLNNGETHITLHLDFIQKFPIRRCEILGEKGKLTWNLLEDSIILYEESKKHYLFQGKKDAKKTMYLEMIRAFNQKLDGKISNLADINSSLRVLEIIEDIRSCGLEEKV